MNNFNKPLALSAFLCYNHGNMMKRMKTMEENGTPKFLVSASGFELERIMTALGDNGIPCTSKPQKRNFSAKAVTGVDMSVQDIYVPGEAYDKAYDLCVGIGAVKTGEEEIIQEPADGEQPVEQEEEMSPRKRTVIRVLSALLFVVIVALVIFGTDAVTGWIKSLFN